MPKNIPSLKPKELIRIYELVNGQRDISKEQALILGSFFYIEPSLFTNS